METLRYVSPEYNQRLRDLSCLLNTQVEVEYHPSPIIVEDTVQGWDESGNYHHPSLRTEHVNG